MGNKKIVLAGLLAAILLLAGCGAKAPTPTGPEESEIPATSETTVETQTTTAPTEPLPETRSAEALVPNTAFYLVFLNRGQTVEVVGAYDETYWVIRLETGYGLVEGALLRMESEAPYEAWTGYTNWNAQTYPDKYMLEAGTATRGAQVEVLDELTECYLVRLEGELCYMPKSQVSRWPVTYGGGGSSEDGGSADGGDISLCGAFQTGNVIPQEGTPTGKATIKADDTEVILGFYAQGEQVDVLVSTDILPERTGFVPVLLSGVAGYVREDCVKQSGEPDYESWVGYARYGTGLYDNLHLTGEIIRTFTANQSVEVLLELKDCFLVRTDGQTGYVRKDMLTTVPVPYGSGGGNDSSGTDEWSPPAF